MNAPLQALAACRALVEAFASGRFLRFLSAALEKQPAAAANGDPFAVTRAFANVLHDLRSGEFQAVAPREMRICAMRDLRIEGAQLQQPAEADEMLASLLLSLHAEMN
eukprot:gene1583-16737_t